MGRSLRALFRRPVLDALSEDERSVFIFWIPSRPKRDYQAVGNGTAILVDDAKRRGKDSWATVSHDRILARTFMQKARRASGFPSPGEG